MKTGKKILSFFLVIFSIIVIFVTIYSDKIVVLVTNLSKKELPIYSVETEEKLIAISFDCAWGVDYTDKLLEELAYFNVRCTFFTVKFWTDKYPDYIKKIDQKGHEIGTHSATHSHMSKLSEGDIISELDSSSKAIYDLIGKPVRLFRAPFGEYNDRLITVSRSQGFEVIQWDVDSLDWKDLSAIEIAMRVKSRVKNGSIILCHNNGLNTAKALPLILGDLIEKGYRFVPIGELIYKENYYIDNNGRQHADT